jgi:hypothetical protein
LLGGCLAAKLGEGERELAGWPPGNKPGRGKAEIAGEMREKCYLVEATFQVAPNREGCLVPALLYSEHFLLNTKKVWVQILMRAL